MLLILSQWLMQAHPHLGFLRVFQYLTFRSVMAAMTAMVIGLFAGPWVIHYLRELKIGQPVRGYAMETHLSKTGTPTMGGVLGPRCQSPSPPSCGLNSATVLSGSCSSSPSVLAPLT